MGPRAKLRREFVSAACNRMPHCLDWNTRADVVAFGADQSVALATLQSSEDTSPHIFDMLVGLAGRVNCVRWCSSALSQPSGSSAASTTSAIPAETETLQLVTGGSDGNVVVWSWPVRCKGQQSRAKHTLLEGHEGSVTAVDAIDVDGTTLIVSVSADETARVWITDIDSDHGFKQLQEIRVPKHYFMAAAITYLKTADAFLLALAGDDMKVHLYVRSRIPQGDGNFKLADVLLGHEDWIRGLDFATTDEGLLLASASQDAYVRLWKLCEKAEQAESDDVFEQALRAAERTFSVASGDGKDRLFRVTLEALLAGHDSKVFTVRFPSHEMTYPLRCVSASADKTMIIWEKQSKEEPWMDMVRLGEVGGNTLGFFGGVFGPNSTRVLAHGYQGAFHLWQRDESQETRWLPQVSISGHFAGVYGIDWEPRGRFLVSTSDDQTTRVFAPWKKQSKDATPAHWHEIGRPQIHGYDMRCIAMTGSVSFASGADEKVLRTFSAPDFFVKSLQAISGADVSDLAASSSSGTSASGGLAIGASVPALGLSNKAVYEGDPEQPVAEATKIGAASEAVFPFKPSVLAEPPLEEDLLQNTLWPETRKLYGHGYELLAVAATPDGRLIASSCRATKPEHATVRIWDTETWQQVQELPAHKLSVVCLSFSPDGQHLLTTSRDRSFCVFRREQDNTISLVRSWPKAHDRIIWDAAWSPDSKSFVTVSRDKTATMWKLDGDSKVVKVATFLRLPSAITAVSVADRFVRDGSSAVVALGLEDGGLVFACVALVDGNAEVLEPTGDSIAHTATIKKLRWRPCSSSDSGAHFQLASCSMDHSVRLSSVTIDI